MYWEYYKESVTKDSIDDLIRRKGPPFLPHMHVVDCNLQIDYYWRGGKDGQSECIWMI